MTELKEEGGALATTDASRAKSGVVPGISEPLVNGSTSWLPLKRIWDSNLNRDPGNLESLKKSIEENGLITPLACTPDGKLLAGRRRFSALVDLGWKSAPFLIIEPADEVHSFRIMLDENVERKPLTDPEMASLIKQFDDMMRKKFGSAKSGGEGGSHIESDERLLDSNTRSEGWSTTKTAEQLGISQSTVSQAIKIAKAVEENPELAHLKGQQILDEAKGSVHLSFNSGNNEWYTPPEFIIAAKQLMGSIDVDPASSDKANEIVGADVYYTKEQDGLTKKWSGNVWMNPPYAQPLVSNFCDKFVEDYRAGGITQGLVFVNNATETAFMQNMLCNCTALCLIKGRVAFLDPDGNPGNPLQGQILLYFGDEPWRFDSIFNDFGVVFYART